MTGHNDIFNETVRAFMLSIIDDVVRRALATDIGIETSELLPPPLLAQPDKLNHRFQEFYRESEQN